MLSTPRGGARVGRFARRGVVTLGLALLLLGVTAAPGSAHADLLESDPAPGAVLDGPPKDVTLTFTEPVDPRLGQAAVFDADGQSIEARTVEPPAPNVLRLRLPELGDGAYIVTWRVSGEDAHPVQGVFTFQVGAAANATSRELAALGQQLLTEGARSDQLVGALYGVSRGVVFGGLALLIGATAFVLLVWPAGRHDRRVRRITWTAWLLSAAGTLALILLYGPYAKARPLGDLFDGGLLDDTLSTRSGVVWAVRVGLLVLAAVVVRLVLSYSEDERVPAWLSIGGLGIAAALAATPGLAAHALVGDWVAAAVASQTVHVLAMAGWLGGLAVLAVALLPGRGARDLRDPLARFSRLASWCIVAIVVTGAFQTWRQVGSFDGLRSTEYGRILVVKLVIVAFVLAVAAFSREHVLRLRGGGAPERGPRRRMPAVAGGADDAAPGDAAELRGLRRSVAAEVVLGVAVLATTALLVNSAPARGLIERGAEDVVAITIDGEDLAADVTLSPGREGRNDVHVSVVDAEQRPLAVEELTVTLAPPDDADPVQLEPDPLDDGHYVTTGQRLRPGGEWTVVVRFTLDGERTRLADTLEIS
jgi:copper transport protein